MTITPFKQLEQKFVSHFIITVFVTIIQGRQLITVMERGSKFGIIFSDSLDTISRCATKKCLAIKFPFLSFHYTDSLVVLF
jgi:hypothetical protein